MNNMELLNTKICSKCRLELSVDLFPISRSSVCGYASYCKYCKKKTYNMDRINQKRKRDQDIDIEINNLREQCSLLIKMSARLTNLLEESKNELNFVRNADLFKISIEF